MMKALGIVPVLMTLAILPLSCSKGEEAAAPASPQEGQKPTEVEKAVAQQPIDTNYSHSITKEGISFSWNLKPESIDIKLVAKTKGWVGIGFNPEPDSAMKGANFIIGSVKDGKVEVFDHFGTLRTSHKADDTVGGKSNVTNVTGSEKGEETEIAFSIPLDSGDATDTKIDPTQETTVLLAYGNSDILVLRHKYRTSVKVNLSTGKSTE